MLWLLSPSVTCFTKSNNSKEGRPTQAQHQVLPSHTPRAPRASRPSSLSSPASLKPSTFLEYFFQRLGSRYCAGLPCLRIPASPQPWAGLTSLPSVSKKSNCSEMRYWVGATSCQMQFLLGGYSLGQPGLVMEPLSLVRNPPQAAGGTREVASPSRSPRSREGQEKWAGCIKEEVGAWVWSLWREGGMDRAGYLQSTRS